MKNFNGLLIDAGLTRTAFASLLGLQAGTIYGWQGDAPQYAIAYLELYIQHQDAEATREQVRAWLL